MILFTNLGNSDIHLGYISNNSPDDPIFRSQEKFSSKLKGLKEEIRKAKTVFNQDGEIVEKGFEFNYYPVKTIKMPILKAAINDISAILDKKISKVICFCTKQEPENEKDTYNYEFILKGNFGKFYFPNIKFEFVQIGTNPSDYNAMYQFYKEYFENNYDLLVNEDLSVTISQGTPAMCFSLSSVVAKLFPIVPQFYTSQINKEVTEVFKLELFSKREIQNQIHTYCTYMKEGSYLAAKEFLNNNLLSTTPGIKELTDYYIARTNYNFDKAYQYALEINNKSSVLFNVISDSIIALDSFSKLTIKEFIEDKEEKWFDYQNPNYAVMLFETLQNVKFNYDKGEYLLAIALMTSFLDCLSICLISRAANLQKMFYSQKFNYVALNDYFHDNIEGCLDIGKNKKEFKDLIKNWNAEDKILSFTGASSANLIKWFANQDNVPEYVKTYYDYQKSQQGFSGLRQLRNQLPIAHSMGAAEKEIINETLLNDLSFEEFIKGFIRILKLMNKDYSFDVFYHELIPELQVELEKNWSV